MNLFMFVVVAAIITVYTVVALPLCFDCCRDICHSAGRFFQLQAAKCWLYLQRLCSSIVNKRFLLFPILSALPPSTFCLWKPWLVVRSLQLEPGWPAPSLLPQSRLQMKNLWLYALKTSDSIWSAAVPLMLPPLMATVSDAFIRRALFLTVGVQIREKGWDGVHGFTLLHWYSQVKDRFYLAVCNEKTLISCF